MSARGPWRWVFAIACVGVLLRWSALGVGFAMDDWAQLAMLDGSWPAERGPTELFVFADGSPAEHQRVLDRGALPWWTDPELRLSAMRPLSSALVWLDVRMFGHDPWRFHLHSLVWWIALVLVVARVLLQLLPQRLALLALGLWVLDECHGFPLAWLANRNAIVAATFGVLAIGEHVRWREHGSAVARGMSIVALVLALAAGEYALCAVGMLIAFEAAARRPDRLRALAPVVLVLLAWACLYRLGGHGSFASGAYFDPAREPIAWLGAALVRVPVLLAGMLLALPTGQLALFPSTIVWQAALGVLAVLGVAALLPGVLQRSTPERARLRWAVLATLVAMLPIASSFLSARLLLVPAITGHVVLAALVLDGLAHARDASRRMAARARAALAVVLLAVHVGLAATWSVVELRDIAEVDRRASALALGMPLDDRRIAEQRVVVLTANDPATLLYPPFVRHFAGHPLPRAWWVLSLAPRPHRLRRTAKDAFELDVEDGAMLRTPVEQLLRRRDRLPRVGERIALDGLTVEIVATDDESFPTTVRYTFDRALEDPSLVFLLVTRRGMIRYPMGPIGASVPVPAGALPFELELREPGAASRPAHP